MSARYNIDHICCWCNVPFSICLIRARCRQCRCVYQYIYIYDMYVCIEVCRRRIETFNVDVGAKETTQRNNRTEHHILSLPLNNLTTSLLFSLRKCLHVLGSIKIVKRIWTSIVEQWKKRKQKTVSAVYIQIYELNRFIKFMRIIYSYLVLLLCALTDVIRYQLKFTQI